MPTSLVDGLGEDTYVPDDASAPWISGLTPANGSPLTRQGTIEFDVIDDNSNINCVMILANYGTSDEVIFDGTSFGVNFSALSTKTQVSPQQYHFTIKRTGGWPASPTVSVFPIDAAGNVGW